MQVLAKEIIYGTYIVVMEWWPNKPSNTPTESATVSWLPSHANCRKVYMHVSLSCSARGEKSDLQKQLVVYTISTAIRTLS